MKLNFGIIMNQDINDVLRQRVKSQLMKKPKKVENKQRLILIKFIDSVKSCLTTFENDVSMNPDKQIIINNKGYIFIGKLNCYEAMKYIGKGKEIISHLNEVFPGNEDLTHELKEYLDNTTIQIEKTMLFYNHDGFGMKSWLEMYIKINDF